jgi:peptidoglycan/xylan/chitin deacetylase (PgdA/CDA1 family)
VSIDLSKIRTKPAGQRKSEFFSLLGTARERLGAFRLLPGAGVRRLVDRALTWLGIALYHCGLARLVIRLNGRSPRVLTYHAIEEGETPFTRGLAISTTPAQLEAHLRFLGRHYRVVPLEALGDGSPDQPCVAITFDDGFRSVYVYAWPLLRAARMPATLFLTTDAIGNKGLIWTHELNGFLQHDPATALPIIARHLGHEQCPGVRDVIRLLVDQFDPERIERLLGDLRQACGVDPGALARELRQYCDWQELTEMADVMRFGHQTASHLPLAGLPIRRCREQIRDGAHQLRHLPPSRCFASPFDRHDERVRDVAIGMGYRVILGTDHEPASSSPTEFDPTRIRRIPAGASSPGELFARMEVVGPVTVWLGRLSQRAGAVVRRRAR